MKYTKSLKISAINWQTMLKTVLVQLLVFACILALVLLAFHDVFDAIVAVVSSLDFSAFAGMTIEELIQGTLTNQTVTENVRALLNQLVQAIEAIPNFSNLVFVSYLIGLLLFMLYRMFIGCCDVPVMCQIVEFMESNTFRPFSWYFFKKFTWSFKFLVCQFVMTIWLDALIVASSMGLFLFFETVFGGATALSLIVTMVCLLLLYVTRQSLYAFWLPCMVVDALQPMQALKKALSVIFQQFGSVWVKYLSTIGVSTLLTLGVVVLTALLGANPLWSLLGGAISFVSFYVNKNIGAVEYFESQQKPYFSVRIKIPSINEIEQDKPNA